MNLFSLAALGTGVAGVVGFFAGFWDPSVDAGLVGAGVLGLLAIPQLG